MSDGKDRSARIVGYIDGTLEETRSAEVAWRIEGDASWREEYDVQRSVRERLGALESPGLLPGARARFGAALRRHAASSGAPPQEGGVVVQFASLRGVMIPPTPTAAPDEVRSTEVPPQKNPQTRRSSGAVATLVLVGITAWQAHDWWLERPPSIVGEAIAQLESVERNVSSWDRVTHADVSREAAALGWVYHQLEDTEQELKFIGFKKVELDGACALNVAYRRDGEVVVELLIDQRVFDDAHEIRDSVWRTGTWSTTQRTRTLVGWNDGKHSVVVIGGGDSTRLVKYRPSACYGYKKGSERDSMAPTGTVWVV